MPAWCVACPLLALRAMRSGRVRGTHRPPRPRAALPRGLAGLSAPRPGQGRWAGCRAAASPPWHEPRTRARARTGRAGAAQRRNPQAPLRRRAGAAPGAIPPTAKPSARRCSQRSPRTPAAPRLVVRPWRRPQFLDPLHRQAVDAARAAGVPFAGLWLHAPMAELNARVIARTGDVSERHPRPSAAAGGAARCRPRQLAADRRRRRSRGAEPGKNDPARAYRAVLETQTSACIEPGEFAMAIRRSCCR